MRAVWEDEIRAPGVAHKGSVILRTGRNRESDVLAFQEGLAEDHRTIIMGV